MGIGRAKQSCMEDGEVAAWSIEPLGLQYRRTSGGPDFESRIQQCGDPLDCFALARKKDEDSSKLAHKGSYSANRNRFHLASVGLGRENKCHACMRCPPSLNRSFMKSRNQLKGVEIDIWQTRQTPLSKSN